MNIQGMMKQVQKAQKEMENAQAEIDASIFEGSVGGVVTVRLYGTKKVESIDIKDEALESGEEVAELLTIAINQAMDKIDAQIEERIGSLTKGMNIPGLF